MPISPIPLAPMGEALKSGSGTHITSRSGTSAFTGTWYSARLSFVQRARRWSAVVFSSRPDPRPITIPPRNWLRPSFRFRIVPHAKHPSIRRTRTRPNSSSTPTSTNCAPKLCLEYPLSPGAYFPFAVRDALPLLDEVLHRGAVLGIGRHELPADRFAIPRSGRPRRTGRSPAAWASSAPFSFSTASRRADPTDRAVALPPETPPLGYSVLPRSNVTRPAGTPSRSAATCACVVAVPVPSSCVAHSARNRAVGAGRQLHLRREPERRVGRRGDAGADQPAAVAGLPRFERPVRPSRTAPPRPAGSGRGAGRRTACSVGSSAGSFLTRSSIGSSPSFSASSSIAHSSGNIPGVSAGARMKVGSCVSSRPCVWASRRFGAA